MTTTARLSRPTAGASPFVLLDDARAENAACARLFRDPIEILCAREVRDVAALLDGLAAARAGGLHVAGYLAYDGGKALAPASRHRSALPMDFDAPLGWFGLFERVERIDADAVASLLPDPDAAWIGAPQPRVARADYEAAVARVLDYIRAGDIYQANLTFRADVPFAGDPLAVYARLRQTARAEYGGFIWTGEQAIASLSPELSLRCAAAR